MPKRKREDQDEKEEIEPEDRALKIRKSRLIAKIDQGNKSIASALKLARGFERQKLGRRQKTAKNEPKELLRLKEEIITLKSLELPDVAQKYLFKQLVRTNRIRETPAFVALYGGKSESEAPRPGAEANVLGRLFNSNPVKVAVSEIRRAIYGILGLQDSKSASTAASTKHKHPKEEPTAKEEESEEFEGFSDVAIETAQENAETSPPSDDAFEEDLDVYNNRLASSSDSSDIEASDNEDGFFETDHHPKSKQSHRQPSPSISISSSDTSHRHDAASRPLPPNAKQTQSHKPPSSTAFLPSLTMGGYYSGSDSGLDDFVPNTNSALPQVRKNRRGQRARQQIAEKKYGKNAKHLQNGRTGARDSGWDSKRGATADSRLGRGGSGKAADRSRPARKRPENVKGVTGANGEAMRGDRFVGVKQVREGFKKQTLDDAGSIHPSWQAAKKRKDQEKRVTEMFTGKKITFD